VQVVEAQKKEAAKPEINPESNSEKK
jgi:hypothetical protein